MLSQQNDSSITWPTVDSGELLLVLGPESIQPGQFFGQILDRAPVSCYLFSARRLTIFSLHNPFKEAIKLA